MTFDWSSLFLFYGVISCLLGIVTAILFFKKSRHIIFFLTALLLCIGMILIERIVRFSELYTEFPSLLYISGPFLFSIYPLTYLFQSFLIRRINNWYLHLIIPITSIIILPSYRMESGQKLWMYSQGLNDPIWFHTIYMCYALFYLIGIFRNNQKHKKILSAEYSDIRVDYHQVINRFIALASILFLCIPIAFTMNYSTLPPPTEEMVSKLLFTAFSFTPILLIISFFIPTEITQFATSNLDERGEKPDYNLSSEERWKYLQNFMVTNKPFLNQSLTLNQLSVKTNIGRTELSKLINAQFEQNFYEFINKYRVDYFIGQVKNGNHHNLSLEALALESGFKSYTSFYRVFKRAYNQSPKDFIKKNQL